MAMTILGPKNYGTDDAIEFALYDFSLGLNIKALPQQLDDRELTAALNVYLRAEGGVEMRRGIAAHGASLTATPGKSVVRFYQETVNGGPASPIVKQSVVQCGGTLFDADAHTQIGPTNALGVGALAMSTCVAYDPDHLMNFPSPAGLTLVGGTSTSGQIWVVVTYTNPAGETTISGTSTANPSALQQVQTTSPPARGNANGYNVYAGSAANGPFFKQNASPVTIGATFTIPGTLLTTTPIPASNTAVAGSDVLVICTGVGGPYIYDGFQITTPTSWSSVAGARWCAQLNGITWFGGILSQQNLLQGSAIGRPEQLILANLFITDAPITGLCPAGQGPQAGLVCGLNEGLAVLYGTGLINFYMQPIPMLDGVVAGRTMIAVNGIVYFLGRMAIYAFDGQSVRPISDKVEPWLLNDPLAPDYPMNGDRSLSWVMWYQNRLYFAYDSGNVGLCNTYLVYHLNVKGGWTVLSGPKLAGGCVLNAPGDGVGVTANPMGALVVDGATGQVYDWDVYNGQGANGHGVDDNGAPIQTMIVTKYFKLGRPGTQKTVTRYYPELFAEKFGGSALMNTDYGALSISALLPSGGGGTTLVWDVGAWDVNAWAGNPLQYVTARLDVDVPGEAFAFGLTSTDTNPPYRFVGVTGTFKQGAKA